MKISRAYICFSCHEVFERAPYGKCQVCNSTAVYPLSWFGRPDEEKSKWFNLINGGKESSKEVNGHHFKCCWPSD